MKYLFAPRGTYRTLQHSIVYLLCSILMFSPLSPAFAQVPVPGLFGLFIDDTLDSTVAAYTAAELRVYVDTLVPATARVAVGTVTHAQRVRLINDMSQTTTTGITFINALTAAQALELLTDLPAGAGGARGADTVVLSTMTVAQHTALVAAVPIDDLDVLLASLSALGQGFLTQPIVAALTSEELRAFIVSLPNAVEVRFLNNMTAAEISTLIAALTTGELAVFYSSIQPASRTILRPLIIAGLTSPTLATFIMALTGNVQAAFLNSMSTAQMNTLLNGLTAAQLALFLESLSAGAQAAMLDDMTDAQLQAYISTLTPSELATLIGAASDALQLRILTLMTDAQLNALITSLTPTQLADLLIALTAAGQDMLIGRMTDAQIQALVAGLTTDQLRLLLMALSDDNQARLVSNMTQQQIDAFIDDQDDDDLNALFLVLGAAAIVYLVVTMSSTVVTAVSGALTGSTLGTVYSGMTGAQQTTVANSMGSGNVSTGTSGGGAMFRHGGRAVFTIPCTCMPGWYFQTNANLVAGQPVQFMWGPITRQFAAFNIFPPAWQLGIDYGYLGCYMYAGTSCVQIGGGPVMFLNGTSAS